MQASGDRASLNADLSRPTTGAAAARAFRAEPSPPGEDAYQHDETAPKAIPPM